MSIEQQQHDLQLFEEVTCFLISIPGVGGVAKLRDENIPEDVRTKMPKELFSMDARIFDGAAIRTPATLRTRLARKLTRIGTAFLSGYLIPDEHLDEAMAAIAESETEYENWVHPFLGRIPDLIDEQCARFPDYEAVIRGAAPSREEIEAKLRFKKRRFKISPTRDARGKQDLEEALEELPGQIAGDFSRLVRESWSAMEGERTKQKWRSVLEDIRRKAKSMAYIDPKLSSLVALIDTVTRQLPPTGEIAGQDYVLLKGLRQMLLDPKEILGAQRIVTREFEAAKAAKTDGLAHGIPSAEVVRQGETPEDDGDALIAPAAPPSSVATEWVF